MSFEWLSGRRLRKITQNGETTEYTYYSDGMRTQKVASDGKTKYYYYDGNNNLIASHFDNNTPNIKVDDITLYFFYDANGTPMACQYGSEAKYYYVKNLQGDVEKIVTNSGEVIVSYIYDAFGNVLEQTDYSTFNLATRNPFRYRGYVYDGETGLYYLQSRYYDPQIGRFLNADVYCDTGSGLPLSTNMFAYCENNPIVYADARGTDALLLFDDDAAGIYGHAAVLIELNDCWYYFSIAKKGSETGKPMHVDYAYLGKNISLKLKNINKLIKKNKTLRDKFKYDNKYRIKGDFYESYLYLWSVFSVPETYDVLTNNCLHVVARALNKGICKGKNAKYYQDAIFLLTSMTIPVYANYAFYHFKKHFKQYFNTPFYIRIFLPETDNPYYYFYDSSWA